MGTRADFYVGRGENAEWIGSIAYDGYTSAMRRDLLGATNVDAYRTAVAQQLAATDSATHPEQGWPWPWEDSRTTDYAYAFDEGKVHASYFGCAWFDPTDEDADGSAGPKVAVFPNMDARREIAEPGTARSGVMVILFPKGVR